MVVDVQVVACPVVATYRGVPDVGDQWYGQRYLVAEAARGLGPVGVLRPEAYGIIARLVCAQGNGVCALALCAESRPVIPAARYLPWAVCRVEGEVPASVIACHA